MAEARLTIVGMGDCRVANNPETSLVTYALGSCVAVAAYDPISKVGGLLHVMLPESSIDPAKAAEHPFRFADTAIPMMFRQMYAAGASRMRLTVYVAGGAQILDDANIFNVGKRNYLAVRKLLWHEGVLITAEAVGGGESRTVRLESGTGRFFVRTDAGAERLLEKK